MVGSGLATNALCHGGGRYGLELGDQWSIASAFRLTDYAQARRATGRTVASLPFAYEILTPSAA
ncbi:hypothetical protein ABT063_46750 [Streptomyces sp. NPDC002838]|uniref:hypothetical protein n=1 Tax=Streptomyces sp. NPDC002838 TaxID=3154436 RepID=UPI00331BCC2E